MHLHLSLLSRALAAIAFITPSLGAVSIAPITSGPYPLGSTNFEVSSLTTAEMEKCLIGSYSTTADIYISDVLLHRSDCPEITLDLPNNSSAFGRHAGKRVNYVAYILYPTTDDNPRPDYVFPYTNTGDSTFPHMQRAGEAPILRDKNVRYPLIVFSHGYTAHGLWDLAHMKVLASQGFIVAVLQHGDGRNYFQACMYERPLAIMRFLDYLLAHPVFGPAIDRERIGMSGSSLGGYTTLAVVGGGCFGSSLVATDKRFRAAFGHVPLVGGSGSVRPFGTDYSALANVKCPFFAVYAEKDTSVPKVTVEAALPKLQGQTAAVLFAGEQHLLSSAGYVEAQTYEALYFKAWLCDDEEAMALLYGTMNIEGGVTDTRTYQKLVPLPEPDEKASLGNCPGTLRLRILPQQAGIRAVFPMATSGVYRYDILGSTDLKNWQCLRSNSLEIAPPAGLYTPTLGSGFRWRVVEVPQTINGLTEPLFLRLRVSQ
jgi:hypothetical protein